MLQSPHPTIPRRPAPASMAPRTLGAALALLILSGCAAPARVHVAPELEARTAAEDTAAVAEVFRVFLVGDAGPPGADPVLSAVRHRAAGAGPQSATVFLGAAGDVPGRVYHVAGHDGGRGGPGTRTPAEDPAGNDEGAAASDRLVPPDGSLAPVSVELADDLTLIAFDTGGWLGLDGPDAGPPATDGDVLLALAEAVVEARGDRVLLVGRHPVLTGGAQPASLRRHLFPLLALDDRAYVPLPLVGSLVVAAADLATTDRQDPAHPRYRAFAEAVREIAAGHSDLVYVSHGLGLQYAEAPAGRETLRQVVTSGGAAAIGDALFATGQRGFFDLRFFADGSATMEAVVPSAEAPGGVPLLRAPLIPSGRVRPPAAAAPASRPDSARVAASTRYEGAGPVRRWLVGEGYRRAWAAPVTAPVLDLDGLTVTGVGGGGQTRSVALEDADGRVYRLRSVDKWPPDPFGLGLTGRALEWGEDATSGLHPFGALVAARLSDAAGLYHTAPRLVVAPDDPRLGPVRDQVAGTLMLLEEYPDGAAEGHPQYGAADRVVSPGRLREKLDEDPDHRVDAPFYLRARLFDVLLGDADRHAGQWRWAAFEPGALDPSLAGDAATDGKVYRPVARDRDFALNDRDGVLFRLAQPHLPKIQGLRPDYQNIGGLTVKALPEDARFLAPLSREDWRREAASLQAALDDGAIEAALAALPPEARALDGDRLRRALTARRDALDEAAMTFYDLLSPVVDVVGTNGDEAVALEWTGRGALRVTVRERSGSGQTLWSRVVDPAETREVRVWARGGDDEVVVRGRRGPGGLTVRVLPGAGEDRVEDHTDGAGVVVYAAEGAPDPELGPRARTERADRVPVSAFAYVPPRSDALVPYPVLGLGRRDGLRLGAGVVLTRVGFGHGPYKVRHQAEGYLATASGGVRARYDGHAPRVLGALDLGLRVAGQTPGIQQNFFGYGEGVSPEALPAEAFRVGLARLGVTPYVGRVLPNGTSGWVGPGVRVARPDLDGVLDQVVAAVPARDAGTRAFAGLAGGVEVVAVDEPTRPSRGVRFGASAGVWQGLVEGGRYARAGGALRVYATPPALPWATVAARLGAERVAGAPPFYDAASVGGAATLRGYRSRRFAGHSAAWAGVEARLALRRGRVPVVGVGAVGAFAFADGARVWDDGAATRWHFGYGAGLWLSVPRATTLTLSLNASEEQTAVIVRTGFAI